ncbi:ATP-binding protein [Tenacibaculum sp. TC6]|uniref:ATP-binding protein n=1 Tax=Tenacibaculum sp. TC6 TaxID=3423223 RepID=UPI003D3696D2
MIRTKKLLTTKIYVLLSVFAVGTLVAVFLVSYLFFLKFESSVEESTAVYEEFIKLDELSKKYKILEEEHLQASLLKQKMNAKKVQAVNNHIDSIINHLRSNFKNDDIQLSRIKDISLKQQQLFDVFSVTDSTTYMSRRMIQKRVGEIGSLLEEIDLIKERIVNYQQAKISKAAIDKKNKNYYLALMMIISSLVAILLLLLSIYKLFIDKKAHTKTASFLENILESTENIVNLYLPVYDQNSDVVDFKIEYASKANKQLTHFEIDDIEGMHVTEVFPFLKKEGIHKLIESFTEKKVIEEISEVVVKGKERTLLTRLFPAENDIKVIISDISKATQDAKQLAKLNAELLLSNNLLKEAEKIAEMGSYVWYMDRDYTVLSDNVYRILGYEPQEFESSSEKFREFTHPEDVALYDANVNEAYENGKPVKFTFRVITKQNQIKYIYTNGIFNKHGETTTMIGVIQDLTKQVAAEKQLQQKNAELIHQNIELESFNRIASHDLQEPLRKVQMYLSRLSEAENLSERNQNYIERATDASKRMRKLIDNLLAFSRINRKTDDFTLVDLNEVLQNVQDELSLKIEESEAYIQTETLPSVRGIDFQLNQLFNNLISNAIKYRDTNKKLAIQIVSKKIKSSQIDEPFVKGHEAYYQIKVIDNGIGFDNNMRDKIFEMFQRLHQKHEYSGTGIGLAICKKIVVKHEGYITATSIKGSGSVFTMYLPA